MNTKKVIKEYYEQLYAHVFYDLDKKKQVFERHNLSKFAQEETEKSE